MDVYRKALAPTLPARQAGLEAIERLSRYQYAVAGDFLELGLAQFKAAVSASTPAQLAATQTALMTQFSERQQSRVREFVNIASDAQSSFQQRVIETTTLPSAA